MKHRSLLWALTPLVVLALVLSACAPATTAAPPAATEPETSEERAEEPLTTDRIFRESGIEPPEPVVGGAVDDPVAGSVTVEFGCRDQGGEVVEEFVVGLHRVDARPEDPGEVEFDVSAVQHGIDHQPGFAGAA